MKESMEINTGDLDGLPLMGDIQHHIDLILGASFHNLEHYCMSLKDNEILHGQVEELIWKDLAKEIMFSSNNLSIS